MRRPFGYAALIFALFMMSCSRIPQVATEDLAQVVQRDGIPFNAGSIPDDVIDHLASNQIVVVGELHFLSEHRDLIADILRDLHARGYRQYLFEWTQAADWLLADYVSDGGLIPGWIPPHDIGGAALTAIRDFNRTLPADERIQVHGIDIHLPDYGGTEGWVGIVGLVSQFLPEPGPLTVFLQADHSTFESHKTQLKKLQAELDDSRSELVGSWGEAWYATISEMVEVELKSIDVRAIRDSDYDESVRLREQAIKWLVDRRIASSQGGTLINIGNTHAQKERLWGTEIEWLGDYLVHKSEVTGGSVMTVSVSAAHIISVPGSGNPDFDLSDSPENELLRMMNQTWRDQIVFLPVDDQLFSNEKVPINVYGDIVVGFPKRHFDAFILLPIAHRDFVGD